MRYPKVDKNQKQVVKELRELGFSVALTHMVHKGFPDFVVGFHGLNILIELKSENGTLTKDETVFINTHKGKVIVAYSTLDVVDGFLSFVYQLDGLREPSFLQLELSKILRKLN